MFGFNSSSSGTTAFGGSSTGGFGGASTGGFGSTNAGGFGSTATSAAAPSTGLFGNTAKPAATTSTGLFGSTATSTAAPSTGLFGSTNTSTAAPTSSLFGGAATSTAAPAGGLFGGAATSTAAPSTGLFGATSSAAAPTTSLFGGASTSAAAPSTGLFGGASTLAAPTTSLFGGASTSAAAPSTGLFGGAATSAAPSTSLFGSTTTSTAAPSSGLFGGASMSAAAPSTSLFGSTTATTAAPSTSLFGSSTTTAAAPTAGAPATTSGAQPALTRKTKFADLPADIQNVLTAVEKQKQVQIQIGSSIIAEETEKEVKEVSRTVQRLGQELEVVKMTLAGDQTRVEDAKTQAQFAVKHAEKAASLVAHATDDGSWAQSGLTPLQVASRQKTLLALQHDNGEATAASLLFNQADAREPQGDKSVVADPYEAVRRIQFASMHQDVASEYYWAWLERVESSAQLLAERLDQLERHVSSAVTRAQSVDDGHKRSHESDKFRPSPKAVSDVIQHQNDSFLAIVSKVAALDDDIRKLKRKLGIK